MKKIGFLFKTKLSVEVTNDGVNNNVSVSFDKDAKVIEILTALEMATQSLNEAVFEYLKSQNRTYTEKEIHKILWSIKADKIGDFFSKNNKTVTP
ncbi:MAG: hypothetical protein ACLVKO_02445 [Dysgonomonas sp.]